MTNEMRHEYRKLNDSEIAEVQKVKDLGLDFYNALVSLYGCTPEGVFPTRELSLAATKIEEAVMWATKHITK